MKIRFNLPPLTDEQEDYKWKVFPAFGASIVIHVKEHEQSRIFITQMHHHHNRIVLPQRPRERSGEVVLVVVQKKVEEFID